jgi:nucleotide-binding universal stress UspA family protein
MMFQNILLPTDGSDQSLRAARVHGYHVSAPLAAVACFSDLIRHAADDYRDEAIHRAKQRLEAIHALASEADVPFDGDCTFDHRPYTAIVGAARQYGCDLIVMGAHGRTGLDRLVLGKETSKVLSCADIPVLVCH